MSSYFYDVMTDEERARWTRDAAVDYQWHGAIEVELSRPEIWQAFTVGMGRYFAVMRPQEKFIPMWSEPFHLGNHQFHCCAVATVAKYTGSYWLGKWGDPDSPDLFGYLDVVYGQPTVKQLTLSLKRRNDRHYCLVVGGPIVYLIAGVIDGRLAMGDRFTVVDQRGRKYQRIPNPHLKPFKHWWNEYQSTRR